MPCDTAAGNCTWMCAGQEMFPAMLAAIDAARETVWLEVYIYSAGDVGSRFLDALVRARARGVEVRVLIDALGSVGLSSSFWNPLRAAGGEVRLFNPLALLRWGIRDHRKLLVCDRRVAFVGGFNIASEYDGDGVSCGWCDVGLRVEGSMADQLADAFQDMFSRADFLRKHLIRWPRRSAKQTVQNANVQLLLTGPGRGRNPFKRALSRDLANARDVQIIMAYFLPTWRIRRALVRVARNNGRVQLILAGKSDVALSLLAGQSLYRRFLKTGVRIFEYQPQVLHAKLLIIDDVVYVGSANLDQRSLNINYELMLRLQDKQAADQAREVFRRNLVHSREITLAQWRRTRTLWRKLKQHWAYFLLVRIDPYIAYKQWRALPD